MHCLQPPKINNNVSPPLGGRLTQREDGAGTSLSLQLGEEGEGVGQAAVGATRCDGIETIPGK